MAGLRRLAWRGGIAMAVRQVLGMGLTFAGLVMLARLIGPRSYGTYVAALGVHTWLALVLQWGVDVFLVRRPDEPTAEDAHQAFTLSMMLGAVAALLSWPVGLLAESWIRIDGIGNAITALLCSMPLQMAAQVPLALLQRRMNYKGLAQSELAGHFSQYGVAVALAWVGAGLTAPLAGWWAQQAVTTLLAFVLAGYRPRFIWRGPLVATMLRQALSYAVSVWIWQMRLLINPLIVARLLGPEAAAAVAVAVRMAEALSFMRIVVWRVSLAALGRLQDQRPLLAAAVSEGMRLQVLAIGSLMLAFSLVAPWLVPFALGHAWGPVVGLFPFLALAYLVNGAFSMHSSALYALGRNVEVAIFHGVHVFMLAVAALLLVPRFGLTGYGMAEAAALCAYLTLHTMTLRLVGEIEARIGLVWLAGLALPLFVTRLGPLAWGGPLLVLALPDTWRALAGWWSQLKDLAHG